MLLDIRNPYSLVYKFMTVKDLVTLICNIFALLFFSCAEKIWDDRSIASFEFGNFGIHPIFDSISVLVLLDRLKVLQIVALFHAEI